ncbi:MAG: toprim domain-containing protein [Smithella sp.]|nr:toprim domain-containing protein [Smithella sp.]
MGEKETTVAAVRGKGVEDMNPRDFADQYLPNYKTVNGEANPLWCPFCHGGGKDKHSFFMNLETGRFKCFRSKNCGQEGGFSTLLKHFNIEREQKPEYIRPQAKISKPTSKVEQYLALRKISKTTIDRYKISEKDGNIAFPYHDEKNELWLIKYRPARKVEKGERKAWREQGGKDILLGMHLCDTSKPLIITEGEIDALSVAEAGIPNATSVPSGASQFAWIDNCWEWLEQFDKIILFGDNDEPGRKMIDTLCKKLGEERCYIATSECKDANELLYRHGTDAVRVAIEKAKPVPMEGIIELADVVPKDPLDEPRIKTNIKWLDKAIGGFGLGELSIWTGKRGEGKSTFLGQMILEAINEGVTCCAYSGELTANRFQDWLHKQAAGDKYLQDKIDPQTGKQYYYLERDIHDRLREWYRGRMYLYDNTVRWENTEENTIIKVFTYAAKRFDCKMFLVDNLMTARIPEGKDSNYYRRQGNFVGELVHFAKAHNVHVHLVAHPKKGKEEDENDSVSGSSEITDRADNVFHIKRNTEKKDQVSAILKITKCRDDGSVKNERIGLAFDEKSKRFYLPTDPLAKDKAYSWEYRDKPKIWREEEPAPWEVD